MLDRLARFDQWSFWVGFFAATLFWWFLGRVLPSIRQAWRSSRERIKSRREVLRLGVEYDYRNDFIRFIQARHLAAGLFSLDEILIVPRLLAPPPPADPESDGHHSDSLSRILPYLPDYPELASWYEAKKLTLVEALSQGANLAIFGPAGSGKSVALAHLGSQIASLSPDAGSLVDLVPFYIHAADLDLPLTEPTRATDLLGNTVRNAGTLSRRTMARFDTLLELAFAEQRAILLLDGVDELPPAAIGRVSEFLSALLAEQPALRVVAAVAPEYYDGLTALGLFPLSMAAWTKAERSAFLEKWARRWTKHIDPQVRDAKGMGIEVGMLVNWLENDQTALTPLELTLRVWAAFAGDSLGAGNFDSVQAYVLRCSQGVSNVETALERLAAQMTVAMESSPLAAAAVMWSRGSPINLTPEEIAADILLTEKEEDLQPGRVSRAAVPGLLTAGVLVSHRADRLGFAHPVVAGWYAGRGIAAAGGAAALAGQPHWLLRSLALAALATRADVTPVLRALLESPDPLSIELFACSRWLRDMDPRANGRVLLMRSLVSLFQTESQPVYQRQRAMAALALIASDAGVSGLCRRLLTSPEPLVRSMCALLLGCTGDPKLTQDLTQLLSDPSLTVRTAASFALALIGTRQSVENVATLLLHGDPDSQRAAAEALSLSPEHGHPLLREAGAVEELLVRRAAIFGLVRTGLPESIRIVEKLQLEDSQWVVRNAAGDELSRFVEGSHAIPRPPKPLHEVGWMVAYAAETGEGVAPGLAAQDLLFRALLKGNVEQKLAAMDQYRLAGSDAVWTVLHEALSEPIPELQTAALQTLWHLRAQGIATDSGPVPVRR